MIVTGILCGTLLLVHLVCFIIILIDAFKNNVWKGAGCLLCSLYALYYAFAEFEHERKWTVVLT